jgi:hypothetical protein
LAFKKLKTIMMKKILLIAGCLFATSALFAQSLEVTPLFGYTFSVDGNQYNDAYNIENDLLYGARLDVEVADFSYFELSVRRNDPSLSHTTTNGQKSNYDAGTAHYMVGFLREFKAGKIKPYGVISAGTSRYWLKGDENYNKWFFSTDFGLGAKMFFNDNIGLRLQASATMPWDFSGGGLYWGIGTGGVGASGGATFSVPVTHFDLSAGLIIRLQN